MLIVQGSGGGFLFHVFDKRSGEPLCGFMRNGRGPGEAFAFDEREVNCFVDLFATRDRIYAPYDGELRVKEFLKPRWNGGRCNFTGSPCSTGTGMRWSGSRPT